MKMPTLACSDPHAACAQHVSPMLSTMPVLARERAEDYDENILLRCVDGYTVELPIAP